MRREIRVLRLAFVTAALLAPAMAVAQAPPKAPRQLRRKPSRWSRAPAPIPIPAPRSGRAATCQAQNPSNKSLSEKLARSDGVICPPEHVDPEIKAPTPPGGAMPVIPPPGSPGGDPTIRPK